MLIVFEWNFERVEAFISESANACIGETWKAVAEQMSRLGRWEFEDYNSRG